MCEVDSTFFRRDHRGLADFEKPNLRKDAVRLEETYHQAMKVLDSDDGTGAHHNFAETMDRLTSEGHRVDSEFANDFLSCCTQVEAAFAKREVLSALLNQSQPCSADESSDISAVGLTRSSWREARVGLAAALFEQKWVKQLGSALATQVTVGCLEHGRLLHKLLNRSALAFERVSRLQSDAIWYLDGAAAALREARRAADKSESEHQEHNAQVAKQHQAELEALIQRHDVELAKRTAAERESRDAAERVGEMMRTLNELFRDMQHNTECTSKADLRDRISRMSQRFEEAQTELAELRPLRQIAARVPILEGELRLAREETAQLRETIVEKDAVLVDLTAREAQWLRDKELLEANAPRGEGEPTRDMWLQKRSDPDRESTTLTTSDEDSQINADNPSEEVIKFSMLCVKCKKSLDDIANIRAAVEGEPEPPRLVCHGYRILLPNLGGHRPNRSATWVRRCIRAVLHGLLLENVTLVPTQQGFPRLPEFTYAFFEPSRAELDALDMVDRRKVIAEADDDRWGLYYGAKLLARENDEARLFWALLDESHGGDFQAFALYCLGTLRKVAGKTLRVQVGVAWRAACYSKLRFEVEQAECQAKRLSGVISAWTDPIWDQLVSQEDQDALAFGGQQSLWVLLEDALTATTQILLKANNKLRTAAVDATKAIAVEAEGRLKKWLPAARTTAVVDTRPCVDVALWLRILTHIFREEQAHRRAAVRLMFETALAGTIARHAPDYGTGREPVATHRGRIEPHEPPPTVDLPQFVSIVRTLWPSMSTTQACSLFREAHATSKGKVDYEVFLRVADKSDFFRASLTLPHYLSAMPEFPLPERERQLLGAAVHVRINLMRPVLDRVMAALPNGAKSSLVQARDQLEAVLDASSLGAEGIDGVQPFVAYRRLLAAVGHVRMQSYELGQDYPEGSGIGGYGMRLSKGDTSPGDFVVAALREMRSTELVLMDFHEPSSWAAIENLQRNLAIGRLALAWRRRMATENHGPPVSIRLRMRRGYLGGRGSIRSRRVCMPPKLLLGGLSVLYEERSRDADARQESMTHFVHATYVARFGVPSIAERAVHDLYFNARLMSGLLPRARIFCIFSGITDLPAYHYDIDAARVATRQTEAVAAACREATSNDAARKRNKDLVHLDTILFKRNQQAVTFYVQAVLVVRRVCRDHDERPLFPATHTTGHGPRECDFWYAPIDLLEKAVHELFDDRLGRASPQLDYLMGELQELRAFSADDDDAINVDAFLVMCMQHWARAVVHKTSQIAAALAPDAQVHSLVGFDSLRQSLFGADRRDDYRHQLNVARKYTHTLAHGEGGGAGAPCASFKAALQVALEETHRFDDDIEVVSAGDGHHTDGKAPTLFSIEALVAQFFGTWDAYSKPIEAFLDQFEVQFTFGEPADALEDVRALAFKTARHIETYRADIARDGLNGNLSNLINAVREKFAFLRVFFDAVHNLRGIQQRHFAAEIRQGKVDLTDIADPDLKPVSGCENSWEFIRDEWTVYSPDLVRPVLRDK